jgi:hypothetical protein
MAQAEEKSASIDNEILFQTQAPEVVGPQVLVQEFEVEASKSRSKIKKLFNNVRITQEVKCINDVKSRIDTKMIGYRNSLINF